MAELEFHGAAQTVTGSMHLLHLSDGAVSLDSGLFQGRRAWAREKNASMPIDPSALQAVLLSHAHIDHSGNIPRLVRDGFTGSIYATPVTVDLCRIMLADSAYLQEEDARYWNEKRASGPEEYIEPLYTIEDAQAAEKHFRAVNYKEPLTFAAGGRATYMEAGHILGSAIILLELEGENSVRLVYTGDLGRFDLPILRDPTCPLPTADYLITECTYADRRHDNPKNMKQSLVRIIDETRAAGGKVIIPAFSVGRTQNIVFYLEQAIADGSLKPLPIYVDSPLSSAATEVFRNHPECFDATTTAFAKRQGDIFSNGPITYITEVEQSKELHTRHEPCVILSASGMCEAGRILHHLKNNVEDKRSTVVVVGYMAEGTLGRRIVERRPELKIFGRMYPLRCRVEILNGFSAHADAADFTRCFRSVAPGLKAAFVVHGEGRQPEAMHGILNGLGCRKVVIPEPGQRFTLS